MTQKAYYESILQLRECDNSVIKEVKEMVKCSNYNIAKEAKKKNGVDLYLPSNKLTIKLGNFLSGEYGGILKKSRKLHTENKQTGKKVYRVTVLFKMLPYRVGDVIRYNNKDVKIVSISTQKVTAKEIKTGKKLFIQ